MNVSSGHTSEPPMAITPPLRSAIIFPAFTTTCQRYGKTDASYDYSDDYSYDYNKNNTNQDIYKLRKRTVCNKNIPFLKIVLEFYKHELGCDQLSPETEIKITNELANINDIRYICKKNSHTLTWKSLFNALLEQNDHDTMNQSDFLKKTICLN